MANASATVPAVKARQGRARVDDPYRTSAASGGHQGPSWTLFNYVVTAGITIIIGLISAVYFNVRDDIKSLREDSKDLRTIQMQSGRDINDLRVSVTKIGSQIENVVQRLTGR